MFKILSVTLKPRVLNVCNHQKNCIRTFLSQAYYCKEIWEGRLNSPILQKVNLDVLYHELDQRFQKTRRISAVDVDIFANAVKDDLFIDELMDLIHKLRLSPDTGNTLNSTPHAVIRALLDHNRIEELLRTVDDRLNYGLFLDDYTANILLDTFWKGKNFVAGSIIASQMMLQEDFTHPLTKREWPQAPKPEEPEEEVKVRVKYLRNPYNDEHFDLREPQKIVGKTLAMATKNSQNPLHLSLRIIGLALLQALEEQKKRLLTAERLAEIERIKKSLMEREQKLWFFENEENIELTIEEETASLPSQKSEKVNVEENYVPPEVITRKTN
ncbi:uncharacterized protein BDFB_001549 [Asbolus verrucosus]|uniref:28S ribosomal protein S27, mitochondrial n=1 Tax=Asbolus verrucosus TaxID=1661398 RepID=A0A482W7Z2_ASBVE|nr:uncharacterized protein BDFB_001549 [Asbolus verrucosus]